MLETGEKKIECTIFPASSFPPPASKFEAVFRNRVCGVVADDEYMLGR